MISFYPSRDEELEHEPVDLGFGQRVRAFLLDRVLRREHEKRLIELECRAADRDLFFLHRLEQRRLNLGGRTVDLVGENDVREDRSALDRELPGRLIVDLSPQHVRWKQIGRELDAMERGIDRLSERSHRERLGETGHTLEQHVAAGEQADEQSVDHVVLADHATRDLPRDVLHESRIRGGGDLCSHDRTRV